jgi:hypothetical protein
MIRTPVKIPLTGHSPPCRRGAEAAGHLSRSVGVQSPGDATIGRLAWSEMNLRKASARLGAVEMVRREAQTRMSPDMAPSREAEGALTL